MGERVKTALAAWALVLAAAAASPGVAAGQPSEQPSGRTPAQAGEELPMRTYDPGDDARGRDARAAPDAAAPADGLAPPADAQAAARPSDTAAAFAEWVTRSRNNRGMPFAVVDKVSAQVSVYDRKGRLEGSAPALLGLAQGDDSAPGVGDHSELSGIAPQERTTPAGRFVAFFGPDNHGDPVLWVDYKTAVSLHHVITLDRREHRLERLASPSPDDNRITYGCINVPTAFWDTVVRPAFAGTKGVVYVLPELRPLKEVFPGFRARKDRWRYDADEAVPVRAGRDAADPDPTNDTAWR